MVNVAIIGLGSRGFDTYAKYIQTMGGRMRVTAIAEIRSERLREAGDFLQIPEDMRFRSAEELLRRDKLADAAFICTPDGNHYREAVSALEKGYHLLLEKPAATDAAQCVEIAEAAIRHKRHVMVCHVLRYSPFYKRIKEITDSGEIGETVNINAVENVGYYHHAHSFVRGKWSRTEETCPMIVAKCCHDMDLLLWLTGKKVRSVSSYGGLYYFKPEKAPDGAADFCLGGCHAKENCPYDTEKIYITDPASGVLHGNTQWPANVAANPATEENVRQALKAGPYGRCVFKCGNDTVDHQLVNVDFEGGAAAHLTMTAFSPEIYRTVSVMGTLGFIEGDMRTSVVKTAVFGKSPREEHMVAPGELAGHGGGDGPMLEALYRLIEDNAAFDPEMIERAVEGHAACYAAERSRLNGGVPEKLNELMSRLRKMGK